MEIKITKNGNSFINKKHVIEELPNNQCMAKPYLSYSEDYSGRSYIIYNKGQVKHIYNLLEPTYICEDIDKILNFISIWQFLESEHLIIDLPKACEQQDMALFLRKKYEKRIKKYFPKDISSTSELKVDASEFMEWGLELNIHDFDICLPYLQKQIQPTLGLGTFVKHNRI